MSLLEDSEKVRDFLDLIYSQDLSNIAALSSPRISAVTTLLRKYECGALLNTVRLTYHSAVGRGTVDPIMVFKLGADSNDIELCEHAIRNAFAWQVPVPEKANVL